MKIRALLLAPAAALAFGAAAVQAEPIDLTENGGFETGDFTGWDLFPTGDGQFTVISPGFESEFAGCIANRVPASAALMKQANIGIDTVMPEMMVTITFDARGEFGVGGVAFAEFFSELEGGGTSSAEILGGAPLMLDPDPTVWTRFEFMTMTGADVSGGVTLQLTATTGGDPASFATVYYDNVSVVVDGVVPVEQGTWTQIKDLYR